MSSIIATGNQKDKNNVNKENKIALIQQGQILSKFRVRERSQHLIESMVRWINEECQKLSIRGLEPDEYKK